MRIEQLDFQKAESLDHALALLRQAGQGAKILAGGTDLVLNLKKKRVSTDALVSLHGLAEHAILRERIDILCQAVGLIGSWQIRNAGTIGGNVCNASPAGDSLPPLLVLDAGLVIAGPDGETVMPVKSFFKGPGQTELKPNQILKEIRIPVPPVNSAGCYMKLRRRKAVDISIAGVAFQAHTDASGQILEQVGIALGGVAPTPVRVPAAEAVLTGLSIDVALELIEDCAQACVDTARPIDDIRATADYKRTIVGVFAQRCARHVLTTLKQRT